MCQVKLWIYMRVVEELAADGEVITDLRFLDDSRGSIAADKAVIIVERKGKTFVSCRLYTRKLVIVLVICLVLCGLVVLSKL